MNYNQWLPVLYILIGCILFWIGYEIGSALLCDEDGQPFVQLPKAEYNWLLHEAAKAPIPPGVAMDDMLMAMGAEGFPKRGDSPCKD